MSQTAPHEVVTAPGEVRKGIVLQETSGPTGPTELGRLGVVLQPEPTGVPAASTSSPTGSPRRP
jgi:hypothetical protein